MVEGYASLAKNAQDAKVWKAGIRNIVGWLRSLRAPGNRKRGLIASVVLEASSLTLFIIRNDGSVSPGICSHATARLAPLACRDRQVPAHGEAELNERGGSPEVVRSLGEEDWGRGYLLADDFTFQARPATTTSARALSKRCWETQIDFITF